jgi:Zn-dependent M28 family amino/carboxypeptidase
MIERQNAWLFFHLHEFRYGDSTDFCGHKGLVRETVRPFSRESSTDTGSDHSAFVSGNIKSVGRMRCGVE